MKSLDQKLGENVSKMGPRQLKEYRSRTKGGETIECLVSISESVLAEVPTLDDGRPVRIRRNNGAQRTTESDPTAEADRLIAEAIGRRDPSFAKALAAKESGLDELSEAARKEYEFCLALGMGQEDSLKVAKLS